MVDFQQIIRPGLAAALSPEEVRRWIDPLAWEYDQERGHLKILAPTAFHRRQVEGYAPWLLRLAEESGRPLQRLTVESRAGKSRSASVITLGPPSQAGPRFEPLNGAHTFQRFIGGRSNRLATMALGELAAAPPAGGRSVVVAASGPWGKTHLLEALAWSLAADPRRRVLKVSGGRPQALANGAWREKEFLLVDDVHLLADSPAAQRELAQAFDEASAHGLNLVLSSPMPPARLTGLAESLCSRLGGGLVLKIDPPEYELLRDLAARRARELGLDVSMEILGVLTREAQGDPRRLSGFLESMSFITSRTSIPPLEALRLLGPGAGSAETKMELATILNGVAAAFGLKITDLTGHSKLRQAAWPRRVAMLLARELTGLTTTEIGEALGGRDHSTVIHALKKIQEELKNQAQAQLVENIKRSLITSVSGV